MCEAYALEGHEVTLLCPYWDDARVGSDAYAFAQVRRNFNIVRLPRIDIFPGTANRMLYWLRTISFLIAARAYLLFHKFDLVVTRDYAALFFLKNCLYEIHTPPKVDTGRTSLLRRALGLAVLTSGIKDFYTERGVSPKHIHISPDAVDPDLFEVAETKSEARTKLRLDPEKFLVGYVGTLKAVGHEKGVSTVIQAMRLAPAGAMACIFGGEPDHVREYQEKAREAGVSDRVLFFGHVSHAEVPLIMRAFDCAVVPLPDVEVFRLYTSPLKVFEYMAAGLPMIVTDLPSLREVLDERIATFIPPGDPEALARAIEMSMRERAAMQAQADRAKTTVKTRFTWRARARAIVEFTEGLTFRSHGN